MSDCKCRCLMVCVMMSYGERTGASWWMLECLVNVGV